MTPLDFIKFIFACWYIAHAVTATDGPLGIFELAREKLPHGRHGSPTFGRWTDDSGVTHETEKIYPSNGLLDCIICFAPWVALALLIGGVGIVADALAVAGGALLLHSFTGWRFGE